MFLFFFQPEFDPFIVGLEASRQSSEDGDDDALDVVFRRDHQGGAPDVCRGSFILYNIKRIVFTLIVKKRRASFFCGDLSDFVAIHLIE